MPKSQDKPRTEEAAGKGNVRPASVPSPSQPAGRPGEGNHPHAFAPSCPFRGRGAAFLDRDGVINDQTAFVNTPDDFRLLPGAAAAVRRLNEASIPVIVVTNQGGIAFGHLTEDDLAAIHGRMADLLAAEGAHLDAIFSCPYYPNGTVPRYAKDSPDRKPGTGMLERARDELGINLRKSILIGDSWTDIVAGNRAGCITVLVLSGREPTPGEDRPADYDPEEARPDFMRPDLASAVDFLIEALASTDPN